MFSDALRQAQKNLVFREITSAILEYLLYCQSFMEGMDFHFWQNRFLTT